MTSFWGIRMSLPSRPSMALLLLLVITSTLMLVDSSQASESIDIQNGSSTSNDVTQATTTTRRVYGSSLSSLKSLSRWPPLFRDPLVDWLDKLHVDVPDQSFATRFVTIEIRDLVCTHFIIQQVESDYQPPRESSSASNNTPQIQLIVHQVAAACEGSYRTTGGVSGKMTAQLAAKEGPAAALQWTVAVLDNDNTNNTTKPNTHSHMRRGRRQPAAVQTVNCETELHVIGLHFSGSVSAKLIELFSAKIEHAVNEAVQDQICPALVQTVDPLLTSYLQSAVRWLQPYLSPNGDVGSGTAEVREDDDDAALIIAEENRRDVIREGREERVQVDAASIIHFDKDLPVVTKVLNTVNAFVNAHLNRGFLPTPTTLDTSCGGFSDGINGVLRELLAATTTTNATTTAGGAWTLPLHPQHMRFVIPKYAAIDLHVQNVTVSGAGLSQWTNLMVLRPTYVSSFGTVIETPSNVTVTVAVALEVSAVPGGMFHGDTLTESFFVQIDAESLSAVFNLSVDIDKDLFQHVTVGTLVAVLQKIWSNDNEDLSMTPEAACLLEPFQSVTVSALQLAVNVSGLLVRPLHSIDNATATAMTNQELEEDIDALLSNIVQLFLTEYQPLVTDALDGLTQGPIQDRLNHFLAQTIETPAAANCTGQSSDNDDDPPHWVNFTEVQPLHRLNAFLSRESTLSQINRYLDCTTDAISEAIRQKLVSLDLSSMVGEFIVPTSFVSNAITTTSSFLQVRDFELKHAGSLEKIEILSPVDGDGFHLQSSLLLGNNSTDATLTPQIFASLDFDHAPLNMSATVNVTIYLDRIGWEGGSILRFDSRRLQQMTLLQLLSHGQCALVPVSDFEVYGFDANLGFFETIVNASVATFGEDVAKQFSIDSNDFSDVQVLASSIFEWAGSTARDMIGAFSKNAIYRSANMCDGGSSAGYSHDDSPANTEEEVVDTNTILLILAAILIFAQPAILLMKRSHDPGEEDGRHRQHDDLVEPLLNPILMDESLASEGGSVTRHFSMESEALMFDASVPEVARHLIPISVLVVIAVLLSSNLSVGATVDLVVSMDDQALRLPSLFGFSLFNTAKDMLKARIYPLFFLVVGFSGVWPYAKLFLMLAAWTSPKSALSSDSRGELLLRLDALAKFSLVDTYVLVVMVVAFRYHLQLLDESALDVYVSPQFGFFGFLGATAASLVIGHLMVFFHRRSELLTVVPSTQADSLFNHAFHIDDGSERRLSWTFRALLVAMLVTVIGLLGVGITRRSFVFEIGGLAGVALGDQYRSSYSLLSLGAAIPESVEDNFGVGIHVLQVAFYFYAVVTPFAALLLLFVILVCPLTLRRQSQLLTVAEIANAWSAIEVFVLSIVAALFEISTFAEFIIGDRCDIINEILAEYGNEEVSTCYTVKSTVSWDAAFLVLGAVLNSCWVSLVLRLLHLSMHERMQEAKGEGHEGENRSFIQRMAASRFASWVLCDRDLESDIATLVDDAGPPIVSEELLSSPWQQKDGFAEEWKDAAERDPTWKEWKEATNVT